MDDERHALADDLAKVLPIVTTEHFNLQTARAVTTSEAVGRGSMYLATVSSSLVALSFAGEVTHFNRTFAVFGAVTFLSLFFLGFVTFDRTLQISIEDIEAAQRINRLRRLYFELAPELAGYLMAPVPSDGVNEVLEADGARASRLQMLLTVAGMVSVLNSVVLGVLVGALVQALAPDLIWLSATVGIVVTVLSIMVHLRIQYARRTDAHERFAS